MTRRYFHGGRAFTLIELLLVLSIIVALLGLGVPLVLRLAARNRMKAAAQEIQTLLNRTRLEAMKTGKPVVFRYRYESPVYEILPKDVYDARKKSETGAEAFMIGTDMPEEPTIAESQVATTVFQHMLPHDIVFGPRDRAPPEGGEAMMISSDMTASDSTDGALDTGGTALGFDENFGDGFTLGTDAGMQDPDAMFDDGWSTPILFFPNGRTSQATLELRSTDGYNYRERLLLRGLTGTAGIVGE